MRSSLWFLSFALLTQFTASPCAAIPHGPGSDMVLAGKVGAMLVLAGPPKSGYKYSAPDSSFTTTFPGKPEATSRNMQNRGVTVKVLTVIYSANGGKRLYAVSSTQMKLEPGDGTAEDAITGTMNGMIQAGNATLSQVTKISYKGASGRQFYLATPLGKEKVRVIAVKTQKRLTVFAVTVLDKGGQVDEAKETEFLDSLAFKLR